MELAGKTVGILVEEQYQDQEVWYPYFRLKEAGARVWAIGTGKKTYGSKHCYPIEADRDAGEVKAQELSGILVPGGFAPDFMRRHETPAALVRQVFQAGKPVAAICHGPWILVSAGVLAGKRATSFFAIKDDVANAGATWIDAEVVVDGNLVTARKPDDLPAFMREFLRLLARA
ncbi:MAG: type 1 glutamine amidotransferase [Planctomycetes bacterium]|nr:type 1 glutamine amidotransferase [Planctomycetota bacterium]